MDNLQENWPHLFDDAKYIEHLHAHDRAEMIWAWVAVLSFLGGIFLAGFGAGYWVGH